MFDKDTWNTPPGILASVRKVNFIALDPCSNATSLVQADREFRLERGEDGLVNGWDTPNHNGLVFVNPPYSRGNYFKWCKKIVSEANCGCEIIALVPANIETKAWGYLWLADAVCFPSKRIRFLVDGKPKGTPKQGSGIVYFGKNQERFGEVFLEHGKVIYDP